MFNLRTYNAISPKGLDRLPKEKYSVSDSGDNSDAFILRSYKLSIDECNDGLLAIGRAGAGVNNIPVPDCTGKGIAVFNTPGANANAVKELVVAGMLLGSRKLYESIRELENLEDFTDVAKLAEKLKSQFAGPEIAGKTLGIVGLGAIGVFVAQAAVGLGMDVVGYDPYISVQNAWNIPNKVEFASSMDVLLEKSDYISLHVPAVEATKGLVNAEFIGKAKEGFRLLNFSRAEIVNLDDVLSAVESGKIAYYVTDFAEERSIKMENVLVLPHMGASTYEAEENCAEMACDQLMEFLENGNVKNSVNLPELSIPRSGKCRVTIIHENKPKMLGQISDIVGDAGLNIQDLGNRSKGETAYTIMDIDSDVNDGVISDLKGIDGVIRVRVI